MPINIPPLYVILLIIITGIVVGTYITTSALLTEQASLIDQTQKSIKSQDRILEKLDQGQSFDHTTLSMMKIDAAQSVENERTMFQYLDRVQEQLRNITNILENSSTTQ